MPRQLSNPGWRFRPDLLSNNFPKYSPRAFADDGKARLTGQTGYLHPGIRHLGNYLFPGVSTYLGSTLLPGGHVPCTCLSPNRKVRYFERLMATFHRVTVVLEAGMGGIASPLIPTGKHSNKFVGPGESGGNCGEHCCFI